MVVLQDKEVATIKISGYVHLGLMLTLIGSIVGSVFWVQGSISAAVEKEAKARQTALDEAQVKATALNRELLTTFQSQVNSSREALLEAVRQIGESNRLGLDSLRRELDARAADRLSMSRADMVATREAIENVGLRKVVPSTMEVIIARPGPTPTKDQ